MRETKWRDPREISAEECESFVRTIMYTYTILNEKKK